MSVALRFRGALNVLPPFLYSVGDNSLGQSAQGTQTGTTQDFTRVGSFVDWDFVDGGTTNALAIRDQTLYGWGSGGNSIVSSANKDVPTLVRNPAGATTGWFGVTLASNFDGGALAIADGNLYNWARQDLSTGTVYTTTPTEALATLTSGWTDCAVGGTFRLAINNGSLYSQGANTSGQTGRGVTTGFTNTFTKVGTDTNWSRVYAGSGYAFALKTDGSIWAWGANTSGRTGGIATVSVPTRVGLENNWADVAIANAHTLALKTDGTLWTCGSNVNGVTGLGLTSGSTTSFTQIGTSDGWTKISVGAGHSLAVNGTTLYGWGSNFDYRLGLPVSGGVYSTPTELNIGRSNFKSISASTDNSFVIMG